MRIAQIGTVFAAFLLGAIPATAQQFVSGSAGVGSNKDMEWVSNCPVGTTVISGSCLLPGGGSAALHSMGVNLEANTWQCVWTHSAPKANVQAICAGKP
jgi:hypothetical protein